MSRLTYKEIGRRIAVIYAYQRFYDNGKYCRWTDVEAARGEVDKLVVDVIVAIAAGHTNPKKLAQLMFELPLPEYGMVLTPDETRYIQVMRSLKR